MVIQQRTRHSQNKLEKIQEMLREIEKSECNTDIVKIYSNQSTERSRKFRWRLCRAWPRTRSAELMKYLPVGAWLHKASLKRWFLLDAFLFLRYLPWFQIASRITLKAFLPHIKSTESFLYSQIGMISCLEVGIKHPMIERIHLVSSSYFQFQRLWP